MVRPWLVACIIIFAFLAIAVGSQSVAADAPTGFRFCTFMPSANNSTTQTIYPRHAGGVTACTEVEAAGDSSVKVLSADLAYHVTTNDYLYIPPIRGNPLTYLGYFPDVGGLVDEYYPIFAMPGQTIEGNPDWEANTSDATILRVGMYAVFVGSSSPWGYLSFSNDSGSSWRQGAYNAEGTGLLYNNITSWEDWTPELLRDPGLSIKLDTAIPHAYSYTMDYLGLVVYWQVEDPNEPSEWEDSGGLSALSIVDMMGVTGFIGMIAVPPMTILAWRAGNDSRMAIFIKMLCLFMFCVTLFLVSVIGG